jgi:hypothetical protein
VAVLAMAKASRIGASSKTCGTLIQASGVFDKIKPFVLNCRQLAFIFGKFGQFKKIISMMIGQDLCFIILTLAIHTRNRNQNPNHPRIVSHDIEGTLVDFFSMLDKASFVTPKGFYWLLFWQRFINTSCYSSNISSAFCHPFDLY